MNSISPPGLVRAILRGETTEWAWPDDRSAAYAFLKEVATNRVGPLVAHRLHQIGWAGQWPAWLRRRLERSLRVQTLHEALVQLELLAVFEALGRSGVRAVLVKGAALAYTVYPEPALRRRGDTDLVIQFQDLERASAALAGAGYHLDNGLQGERVTHQRRFRKIDRHGMVHDLDVHWKISNRPMFEDLLSWAELEASAVPVPALGPHALATGTMHGLTLACVHPVAHHGGGEAGAPDRILWVYDVHLLMNAMTAADFDRWIALVRGRQIRAICARALHLARDRFGTIVPPHVDDALRTTGEEPSAWYLSDEPWRGDVRLSDLRTSPGLRAKVLLVREVVFPPPSYIREAYGVANPWLVGYFYLYRVARGCWKLLQRFRGGSDRLDRPPAGSGFVQQARAGSDSIVYRNR